MHTSNINQSNQIEQTEMLTNLSFLEKGMPWPPPSQSTRLERYRLNKSKFDNKMFINEKAYNHIISLVDDRFRVISYRMLINLYRKVTYKTADLLFVERPRYVNKDEAKQNTISEIVKLSKLGQIGYEGAEDVSILGDTVYTIEIPRLETAEGDEPEQGKARMGITNPRYWFPVVHESNLKLIKHHVLAWVITRVEMDSNGQPAESQFLKYQIHSKGSYTNGERTLDDSGELGESTLTPEEQEKKVDTGLSDFAVEATFETRTSDTIFGIDSYTDLINLIDELQIRLEKIAGILDVHSDPSMSGPTSALEKNPDTGEYTVKLSKYFTRDNKDDPDAKYITWDGKLDSSFKEIELILDLISIISEMGAAIFDRGAGSSDLSGRALKLLYVSPLTKAARVRNNFDDTFKHMIALCSEVGYGEGKLIPEDVNIEWMDGLPEDDLEKARVQAIRLGGRSNQLVASAVASLDGLTREQSEAKAEEIAKEEQERMVGFGADFSITPPIDLGDDDDN